MLENPFWRALTTENARYALSNGIAVRYPAEVIPFGGVPEATPEAMAAFRDLMAPGEAIVTSGESFPDVPGLIHEGELSGWQMHFTAATSAPEKAGGPAVEALSAVDAAAMVGLTDVAFPGYFRSQTYRLGTYYGIRSGGELVAMAGERISLPGYREISAVCTHPQHTGRGYAAALIRTLLRAHAAEGIRSFLHVAAANDRAIALYERLGFTKAGPIIFHTFRRGEF